MFTAPDECTDEAFRVRVNSAAKGTARERASGAESVEVGLTSALVLVLATAVCRTRETCNRKPAIAQRF
jgi:hypothetical protein